MSREIKPYQAALKIFLTEFDVLRGLGNLGDVSNFGALKPPDGAFSHDFSWGTKFMALSEFRSGHIAGGDQSHMFINTGPGCIVDLSLSRSIQLGDETFTLLAVAKSDTPSPAVQNSTTGTLQIWSIRSSEPTKFQLELSVETSPVGGIMFIDVPFGVVVPLVVTRRNGDAEIFNVYKEQGRFQLSKAVWVAVGLNAHSSAVTMVDAKENSAAVALALGGSQGCIRFFTLLVAQQEDQSLTVSELSQEQNFVCDATLTALCWMPGSFATFYVAGSHVGDMLICDRRNPLDPIIGSAELTTRRVDVLHWERADSPIVVGQLEAALYSYPFMESSRHSPQKLYSEIKLRTDKTGSVTEWGEMILPPHRRGALGKAVEQPCRGVTVIEGQGCFTFEDGSVLVGNVKEMDRKAYADAGLISWSLLGVQEEDFEAGNAPSASGSGIDSAAKRITSDCEKGYESALDKGVHVMVSKYYAVPGLVKAFKLQDGSPQSSQYVSTLDVLALTCATSGYLPGWGSNSVMAYGSALGLIHLFKSHYFSTLT